MTRRSPATSEQAPLTMAAFGSKAWGNEYCRLVNEDQNSRAAEQAPTKGKAKKAA